MRETVPSFLYSTAVPLVGRDGGGMGFCSGDVIEKAGTVAPVVDGLKGAKDGLTKFKMA